MRSRSQQLENFHRKWQNTEVDDKFTREEVQHIIEFMDPNGDNMVSIGECNDAFRRCHLTTKELAEEHSFAMVIMNKIERNLKREHMRVSDLYKERDVKCRRSKS